MGDGDDTSTVAKRERRVGDGGWVVSMMVVVDKQGVCVDDAQIERRHLPTPYLGVIDSVPLVPVPFLPGGCRNDSGGIQIPFRIPPELFESFGRCLGQN